MIGWTSKQGLGQIAGMLESNGDARRFVAWM